MTFARVLALFLLVVTAACATPDPIVLSEPPTASLSGKQVHMAREATPSFGAITAGKAMLGVVGALAAHSEGEELVARNGIEDPAVAIEQALIRHLRARYRAGGPGRVLEFGEEKPGDLGQWAQSNRVDGLIVDVETEGWGFNYFPTTWTKYRVGYRGTVRLIDVASRQVIAQYQCVLAGPETADEAPTYDQLTANGAAGLKAILNQRAKACVEEVTAVVF